MSAVTTNQRTGNYKIIINDAMLITYNQLFAFFIHVIYPKLLRDILKNVQKQVRRDYMINGNENETENEK